MTGKLHAKISIIAIEKKRAAIAGHRIAGGRAEEIQRRCTPIFQIIQLSSSALRHSPVYRPIGPAPLSARANSMAFVCFNYANERPC